MRRGLGREEIAGLTRIDPWFLAQMEELIAFEEAFRQAPDLSRDTLRRAKRLGLLRPAAGRAGGPHRGRAPAGAAGPRHPRHLQGGGHLRGGVRGPHALPLLDLRGGGRGAADRAPEGGDPRVGAEPDRPGHRVRLRVRPRGLRAPRGGRRGDHGQLQPGDGVDRLRHVRPPLLRAPDPRGRPQHRREGAAARGDRPVRRADAAQARGAARAGGRPDPGDVARTPSTGRRTASASPTSSGSSGSSSRPTARRAPPTRRRGSRTRWGTRCWCAPPTSSAGGPWRSSTRRRGSASGCGSRRTSRPTTRSSSTSSSRTRSRSTSTRSRDGQDVLIGGVMEHIEKAGIHSGDSACALPPYSIGDDQVERLRDADAGPRPRAGRGGPAQHPVRDQERHDLRARGQPARVAHRAVRLEGDRAAARQAGDPGGARRRRIAELGVREVSDLPLRRRSRRRSSRS